MNRAERRGITYLLLLIILPIVAFLLTIHRFDDNFIALGVGYLSFVIILRFGNYDDLLSLVALRKYWEQNAKNQRRLVLSSASFENSILTTTMENLLGDKNVDTLSKVKVFVAETNSYLSRFRNFLLGHIFVNFMIVLGLIMLHKAKIDSTAPDKAVYTAQLVMSYFSVLFQSAVLFRVLLHYKERNNHFYAELSALDTGP